MPTDRIEAVIPSHDWAMSECLQCFASQNGLHQNEDCPNPRRVVLVKAQPDYEAAVRAVSLYVYGHELLPDERRLLAKQLLVAIDAIAADAVGGDLWEIQDQ